jgi:hypothetical protein
MMTLNMIEASVAQTVENAALLSPCHIQNSRSIADFCGRPPWEFFGSCS